MDEVINKKEARQDEIIKAEKEQSKLFGDEEDEE